jgi:hypothetical protein
MNEALWFIGGALFLYFCCTLRDLFKSDCWRNKWGQY